MIQKNRPICYIVIPCYNEEDSLPISSKILAEKLNQLIESKAISPQSKILFVDDGSSDKTWQIITDLHNHNPAFTGLKLSTNKGHQNALLAGLLYAKNEADFTISMDVDLQDDIGIIEDFIDEYSKCKEIVYGVRRNRKHDAFFKKMPALCFYKIMNLLGAKTIYNHADYRLLSKKVLNDLQEYREVNIFLRGIITDIGYDSSIIYYDRKNRVAGETKYPFKKSVSLALEAITSFSISPIRMLCVMGVVIFIISLFFFIWFFIGKILGYTIPGYASLICSIWMLGGLQLLALGIIGEYIGKTYMETKRRPRYIIEKILK